jgi:hypothetical protein
MSRNSQSVLWCGRRKWNPQIIVNLPVTNVPRCISRNAKTLRLYHLQPPDVSAGSRPPDRACVIHHKTDELLVEQHTVSDGQAASPVKEGSKHAKSLGCLFTYLADVCWPGELSCVSRFTARYRAVSKHSIGSPSNRTSLGFWMRLAVLSKSISVLFEALMAIFHSCSQCSSLPSYAPR